MAEVFLKVLNMSLSAGWLILAVLALRFILRKAPKWIHVLLWGIVAIRLVCPFTLESVLSLIPSKQVVSPSIMLEASPQIQSGVEIINSAVNPILTQTLAPNPSASVNPLQILIPLGGVLWAAGSMGMLVYAAVSYFRLRRQVRNAVSVGERIYVSEQVPSAFILGISRPRIYLPAGMAEATRNCVAAHELSHIRRKDHWWKPLGFLLLSLHWFNPLMWLAYILLCRDIEMACDEKAIRGMERQQRADYSQALLQCSISRRAVLACPLAFGEVGVKQRIQSVLRYKKPGFWIVAVSLVLCAVLAVCFLTDPKTRYPAYDGKSLAVWIQDGDSANKGEARWNFFDIEEFEGVTLPGANPVKLTLAKVTENGLWLLFDNPLLHDGEKTKEVFLKPVDRITLMTPTAGGATWYGFSIVNDSMITGDGDFVMSMYTPLEGLPPAYSPEQAQQDGCVVMKNGDVVYGKDIWWNFYMAAQAGSPSGVRIMDYYDDPRLSAERARPWFTVMDLTYDGAVYRIRWFEDAKEYNREYKHLRRFQGNAESPKAAYSTYDRYVLTDDIVSWTGIWDSLLSSQVPPAETPRFQCVYTNLVYPDEPGYGTLAAVMSKLEPLMHTLKIVSLDVNEITWTLDIGFYEKHEELEELVYQLLDPQYVRFIQIEGVLKPTDTHKIPLDMVIEISKKPGSFYPFLLSGYHGEIRNISPPIECIAYEVFPEGYELILHYNPEDNSVWNLYLIIDNGWGIDVLCEDVEEVLALWNEDDQIPKLEDDEISAMNAALEEICSSPLEQSNPGAYIAAHPEAYESLLSMEHKTLCWAFGELMEPGSYHTDLRGHILAQVCRDIMASWGEEYDIGALEQMTGGAWFYAFNRLAIQIKGSSTALQIKTNNPGAWMFLNLMLDDMG